MENNNIALSDAERNKELFEYEMTEVILQLKGEFAKISGKELHLDEAQFENTKLDIPLEIPDVTVKRISLYTGETDALFSGDSFDIPEVKIQCSKINCPAADVPDSIVLESVQLDKPELDCPTVNKMTSCSGDSFKIPEVKIECPAINCPTVCKSWSYDMEKAEIKMPVIPETSKKVSVSQLPQVSLSPASISMTDSEINLPEEMAKVTLASISTNIPEISVSVSMPEKVSVEQIYSDMPDVKKIGAYQPVNAEIRFASGIQTSDAVNVKFPNDLKVDISPVSADVVSVPKAAFVPTEVKSEIKCINEMEVPDLSGYSPLSVTEKQISVKIPDTPKFSAYVGAQVSQKQNKVEIPDVIPVRAASLADVTMDIPRILHDDIHVPAVRVDVMNELRVDVKNPEINFDYPTVGSVSIPALSIEKSKRFTIPDKPDFSTEIQEIIESAV